MMEYEEIIQKMLIGLIFGFAITMLSGFISWGIAAACRLIKRIIL